MFGRLTTCSSIEHRRQRVALGTAGALALAALMACATTYRKPRPDLPPSERTVAELGALLEDFERAIAERRFEVAEAMLKELDEGVAQADFQAITHWDFQRVASGARQGRARLDRAIRGHAVERLEADMQARLKDADAVVTALSEGRPTEPQLDQLARLRDQLEDLLEEGAIYARDPGHEATRARVQAHVEELRTAEASYRWLWAVDRALAEVLGPLAAPTPEDLSDRIAHAEAEANALAACQRVIDEHQNRAGRSEELALDTPLGRHPVADLPELCATREEEARGRLARLLWQRTVENIARSVTDTLRDIEAQQEAAAILGANQRAAQALELCALRLADTEADPGFVADMRFASHVGNGTALDLRERCAKVREALLAQQPTLQWKVESARVLRDVEAVRARLAEVGKQAPVDVLEEIARGFADCATRAAALAKPGEGALAGASPSRSDQRAMRNLARTCEGERKYVGKLLAKGS